MLGAIRRVISVSDDVGKEEEAQQQQQPQQQSQQQQQEKSPDRAPQRANLVEPDMMDVVGEEDKIMETTYRSGIPVQLIQQRTSSGDSSDDNDNFSDVSMNDAPPMDDDDDNVNMDETLREDSYRLQQPPPASPLQSPHVNAYAPAPPPLGLSRTKSTLQRMESKGAESSQGSMRASSQNSSRDWGWFEDVHLQHSDRGLDGGTEKAKHKKKTTANSASSPARIEAAVQDIILQQHHQIIKDTDAAAMAVTAPTYVLEESLSNQRLWKDTAGQRPPQPVEERAFYEKMWSQNFVRSQVKYHMPVEVLTATSPISMSPFSEGNYEFPSTVAVASSYNLAKEDTTSGNVAEAALVSRMHKSGDPNSRHVVVNKKVKGTGSAGDLTVMVRGDNAFGTTVSKSFARPNEKGGLQGVDTVNISIASYRVVESRKHGKFAQFLVIYREGNIRDTVGVWKRYSDFEELADKVTQSQEGCVGVIANMSPLAVTEEPEQEHLPNAMTSWQLQKKRQRWFRCLDAGYLSLKVFLLERFLHDILFESSTPTLLRDFVGAESIETTY